MNPSQGAVTRSLQELESRGLAHKAGRGEWALTQEGLAEARRAVKEREKEEDE
jgi:Mn-dependent DtxR family transcriptional regulator